jgi:Uma2 family endonuclease
MSIDVRPRKFTVAEYAKMGEAGVFAPDERVELIEGEIIPVSPQNRRHASRVARLNTLLVRSFGETHEIRVQLPLTLGEISEPEPDFALVPFEVADQAPRHPGGADLVLELSDSSLGFDRNQKASLYAKAGIGEYWVLNLRHGRLEVRQQPAPHPDSAYGFDYSRLTILAPGQSAAPLFAPQTSFDVATLLGL